MCTPGVRGACDRYIDPNFPAPIRPTLIGRPCASRCFNNENRFIVKLPSARQRRNPANLMHIPSASLTSKAVLKDSINENEYDPTVGRGAVDPSVVSAALNYDIA